MQQALRNTPFFRLVLPLICGICLQMFDVSLFVICTIFVVGAIILFVFFALGSHQKMRFASLFGFAVFLLMFAIGAFSSFYHRQKSAFYPLDKTGVFLVQLLENPIEKLHSFLCRAQLISSFDSLREQPSKWKAMIYVQKDSLARTLTRGDRLLLYTSFGLPQPTCNPESFDYATYLKRKGFGATAYVSTSLWQRVGHDDSFSLSAAAERSRMLLLQRYRDFHVSGNEFGMLAALTLGYKDALTPELRESFSTTGAMHILAVSGMHVGILYLILSWVLTFMDKNKWLARFKSILIILMLWGYAFITGLAPSVTRAAMMFSFMKFAEVIGRKSQIYNTIFLSAFILLLFNPMLIFDVGFQLSYSAVLSIVYFQPRFSLYFQPKTKIIKWAWDLICVALAAQIGTAPWSIYYFHQFPNYFLLSNFVVIPAASVILFAATAFFVTSWIPLVGTATACLLQIVLQMLHSCIAFIEHLPYSLSTLWIGKTELCLLYVVVLCWMLYFKFPRFVWLFGLWVFLFVFFGLRLLRHYESYTNQQVVVFKHSKVNVVNFISSDQNLVYTNDTLVAHDLAAVFWLRHRASPPVFLSDTILPSTATVCCGNRYIILTSSMRNKEIPIRPLSVDYLILARPFTVDSILFTDFFSVKKILLSGTVPRYLEREIHKIYPEKIEK